MVTKYRVSWNSEVEKVSEVAEIGYRVVGRLDPSEKPFKPWEPAFPIVQIASHQFKVSNDDSIFTKILKFYDVDDKGNGANGSSSSPRAGKEVNNHRGNYLCSFEIRNSSEVSPVSIQGLTANQLAAKELQLGMKGKVAEAEELSDEDLVGYNKPTTEDAVFLGDCKDNQKAGASNGLPKKDTRPMSVDSQHETFGAIVLSVRFFFSVGAYDFWSMRLLVIRLC